MADEPRQDDRPRGRMAMRWPVEIRVVLIGAAALVLYHAVGSGLARGGLAITFLLFLPGDPGSEPFVRR